MKSVFRIVILLSVLTVYGCKKEYTCVCQNLNPNGGYTSNPTTVKFEAANRTNAENRCKAMGLSNSANGSSCSLQ